MGSSPFVQSFVRFLQEARFLDPVGNESLAVFTPSIPRTPSSSSWCRGSCRAQEGEEEAFVRRRRRGGRMDGFLENKSMTRSKRTIHVASMSENEKKWSSFRPDRPEPTTTPSGVVVTHESMTVHDKKTSRPQKNESASSHNTSRARRQRPPPSISAPLDAGGGGEFRDRESPGRKTMRRIRRRRDHRLSGGLQKATTPARARTLRHGVRY